jgi:hypothetical protein
MYRSIKLPGKPTVMIILIMMVAAGIAVSAPPESQFKNLKVLPRNISSKDLSGIMVDMFGDGLGVSCNFCHAKEKGSEKLDYVSDAKPEKEMARSMMLMTMKINKKYFQAKHPVFGDPALVIGCSTCHNGMPRPAGQ